MRVISPAAKVDYGFAKIMGFKSKDVQAEATVALAGGLPPKEEIMPMWLPSGCLYGPGTGDTSSHGSSSVTTLLRRPPPRLHTCRRSRWPWLHSDHRDGQPAEPRHSGMVQVELAGLAQEHLPGSIRFAFDSTTVGVATAVSWT